MVPVVGTTELGAVLPLYAMPLMKPLEIANADKSELTPVRVQYVRDAARSILLGLHALHGMNIRHLDVKP